MKKIFALMLSVLLVMSFAGCGKEEKENKKGDRELYNGITFSKYVTLGEYQSFTVDTSSATFQELYAEVLDSDVSQNDFYVKKSEGAVESGDVANIDYIGTKDGVAFSGGTAQGYDLEIGSGSFIDGFEDGLIGKQIGSTVDLNLTFPEGYQSEELAGKDVIFTVTINYVKTETPMAVEEYYKQLGFASVADYEADVKKRATRNALLDMLIESSEVKDYPKSDYEMLIETAMNQYEQVLQSQYGMDLETYLSYSGDTEENFRSTIAEQVVEPMMDSQLAAYALLDCENITVSDEDIEEQINLMIEQNGSSVTKTQLIEYFGSYYFEALAVNEKAADFLYRNAVIQ